MRMGQGVDNIYWYMALVQAALLWQYLHRHQPNVGMHGAVGQSDWCGIC